MERYFYQNSNNEQAGPVSPMDFSRYGITETTMIWKQGMQNWMQAGQVPELAQYFGAVPPPTGNSGYGGNNGGNTNGGNYANGYTNTYGNSGWQTSGGRPAKPDNNMIWAILATAFCCAPLGVYSIIQASKVNGLYNNGKYAEAQRMADEAKQWAWVSAVIGLIVMIIGILAELF